MNKTFKGFTLIELLIVIAIIGILASIVLVSLTGAREKAQIATYKAQVHSFQAAAILVCDSDADGNIAQDEVAVPVGANNRMGTVDWANGADSCGVTGAGTFNIGVLPTDLGTGAAAVACESTEAVVTETGVVFPNGC